MKNRIKKMIEMILIESLPWVKNIDGVVQFVDPLDGVEISAHYGATHMAASLIIYGDINNDVELVSLGEKLLFSILDRWNDIKSLPGFHNDFNNFALCVIDSYTDKYHDRITETVMGTADTHFDTVNWLPMRWFVNRSRYKWTQDIEYEDACKKCASKIRQATYSDGYIDDMIPKGRSYSLQYNVATVAFMQFLRVMEEDIDLSVEIGALLNAVCPDGDINYLGRGTNQIFAWGLWIYLLASSNQSELGRALAYLDEYLPKTIANNNIMLNEFSGEEKYMWWDYHYCSVYIAHLLLWLILAYKDYGKKQIEPKLIADNSSGIRIYRNSNSFVVTFDGRSEYLAEYGPCIAALWTKESGAVCKGCFGPWYGLFGNKYRQEDATLKNFFGIYVLNYVQNSSALKRIMTRLRTNKNRSDFSFTTKVPLFLSPVIDYSHGVTLTYNVTDANILLNIPIINGRARVIADGKEIQIYDVMKIRNQYGWVTIKQHLVESVKTIEIILS